MTLFGWNESQAFPLVLFSLSPDLHCHWHMEDQSVDHGDLWLDHFIPQYAQSAPKWIPPPMCPPSANHSTIPAILLKQKPGINSWILFYTHTHTIYLVTGSHPKSLGSHLLIFIFTITSSMQALLSNTSWGENISVSRGSSGALPPTSGNQNNKPVQETELVPQKNS